MDPKESSQLLATSSHQWHLSEHSTTATHPAKHPAAQLASEASSSVPKSRVATFSPLQLSHTLKKIQPQQARAKARAAPRLSVPPGLSVSNMGLVLALGLEEVYKRMAENHKFQIDVVQKVAASQPSLEHTDKVLYSMRKAAEHEYARLMKQEFDKEEEEEEEEEDYARN
jgi:hypothetical protein